MFASFVKNWNDPGWTNSLIMSHYLSDGLIISGGYSYIYKMFILIRPRMSSYPILDQPRSTPDVNNLGWPTLIISHTQTLVIRFSFTTNIWISKHCYHFYIHIFHNKMLQNWNFYENVPFAKLVEIEQTLLTKPERTRLEWTGFVDFICHKNSHSQISSKNIIENRQNSTKKSMRNYRVRSSFSTFSQIENK